jgi:hypothetical protein
MFWPGLLSIHRKKQHWDANPDDLLQNIIWAFFKAVCRIDVDRRKHGLVQKIYNDTCHFLYDEYRHEWDRERAYDPKVLMEIAGGAADIGFAIVERRIDQDMEISRLKELLQKGLIREVDLHLIVGTRIYGERLTDAAEKLGLNYQAAKKRRQRAEAKIRR